MVELTNGSDALYGDGDELGPNSAWSARPYLTSSDLVAFRIKDGFNADARDLSRSNGYAKSALSATISSVIGVALKLQLAPNAAMLGVSPDTAMEWAKMVEARWEADAHSPSFCLDAARRRTFAGLMRTAMSIAYVSGETLASVEWKRSFSENGTRTCLNLIAPERLSDPLGMIDYTGVRRMGVDRDKQGAPEAYHIREQHQSDAGMWGFDQMKWNRVKRFSFWGRPNILHYFEDDQADMTRGISSFSAVAMQMRMLDDYARTELESAALRATYAAVIETESDWETAMQTIGPEMRASLQANGPMELNLKRMASAAQYYRGQDFRYGKSKVAHLLPDEKLHMVQGTQNASALKDFTSSNVNQIAAGLSVSTESMTKNFSDTNYSGARASLYNVHRGHMVTRDGFVSRFGWPFFTAWLEEHIALRGTIPMLGDRSFYECKDSISQGSFETWGKIRLDPLKEVQADQVLYNMGATTLKDICASEGYDYEAVLAQRAKEKATMAKLGLKPEDINPELIMNQGAQPKGEAGGGTSQ